MGKKLGCALIVFIWMGLGSLDAFFQPPSDSSSLRLQKVQLAKAGKQATLTLRFSQPPDFVHAFVLRAPVRLVIDVGRVVAQSPSATYTAADALVARLRIGSHPIHTRFVFDLKADQPPPFSVKQQAYLVTILLNEQADAAQEVHTQVLFSLTKTSAVAQNVPPAPEVLAKSVSPPLPPPVPIITPVITSALPPPAPQISSQDKPPQTLSSAASQHLRRGQTLYTEGNLDGAIRQWRKAAHLAPTNAEVQYRLGLALQDSGDLTQAIAAFGEALRLNPNDATVHIHLARALEVKGDTLEALAAYNNALRLVPTSAHVHNRLGHLLVAEGDVAGAVNAWQQTIQLQPNYAYAYVNLGEALEQLGRQTGALAAYERALLLDPRAPFAAEVHRRVSQLRGTNL